LVLKKRRRALLFFHSVKELLPIISFFWI